MPNFQPCQMLQPGKYSQTQFLILKMLSQYLGANVCDFLPRIAKRFIKMGNYAI